MDCFDANSREEKNDMCRCKRTSTEINRTSENTMYSSYLITVRLEEKVHAQSSSFRNTLKHHPHFREYCDLFSCSF